jgi:hypothetical protein
MRNRITKTMTLVIFLISYNCVFSQSSSIFIKNVKTYQDLVKIKRHERPKKDVIDTTTFDLGIYFGMFDKLHIKPNYKLHYLFIDDFTSGFPVIYVKHDTLILVSYVEQYLDNYYARVGVDRTKITEETNEFRRVEILYGFAHDTINKAKNNIIPDDSKMGYLQYLYFNLFGDNFALKWHANYWRGNVIFSKDEMKRYFDFYTTNDDYKIDGPELEILNNLLDETFEPVITRNNSYYEITWHEWFLFRGIFKRTYTIKRYPPFNISKITDEEIVSPCYNIIY